MDFGGGDGWTSHDTSQNKTLDFQTLGDKLPIPVTLSSLDAFFATSDEESYKIGEFEFRTIQTVGIIIEIQKDDGRTNYVCHDPENSDKTFNFLQFGTIESGGSRYVEPNLEEDVRVKAIGKIKNLAGEKKILVYYLQKLTDNKDFEIFKLEAQVAHLFFEKNLIEKMRCNQTKGWQGMLAPPISRQTQKTENATEKEIGAIQPTRPPATPRIVKQDDVSPKTTPVGAKSKVVAIIKSEALRNDYGENSGVPFQQILTRCATLSENRLREILAELEEAGTIYVAQSDEFMCV